MKMETEETLKEIKMSTDKYKRYHQFFVNNNENNKKNFKHKNNSVDTARYNIITFFPKALFFQFLKILNFYFLAISMIQVTSISPLSPMTCAAFGIVILIALIREAIEDYARHQFDKETNNEKVRVYRNGKWVVTTSESLEIGDLVLVKENEEFPADLILLDSNLNEGICYLEMASLDGETKLKQKISNKQTCGFFHKIQGNNNELKLNENFEIKGKFVCDPPNYDLYKLDGFLEQSMSTENESRGLKVPIDAKQLLLKGAFLKNTEWIVGFVVYTGHKTKLIINSTKPKIKTTKIIRLMYKGIFIVFCAQCCLCAISAALNNYFYHTYVQHNPYLPKSSNPALDSFYSYFSYMVLLNTMIPISLVITLEIVRSFQGAFISYDIEMYSYLRRR
jgi:phospholipid-transporting ATPase